MSYDYIASPYSDPDPAVRLSRYRAALDFTASLLRQRRWSYSPIVHCHELAIQHTLPADFAFWQHYNRAMLEPATRLVVLCLDGWTTSKGVQAEIGWAEELGKPITRVEP